MIKNVGKIHAAATYFAFVSRDITAIAKAFGVDTRTIRRWAKDEEWEIALGNVNYTGDRSFETQPYRDTERDAGDTFEKARTLYIEALNTGVPKHKRRPSRCGSHRTHTAADSELGEPLRLGDGDETQRMTASFHSQTYSLKRGTDCGTTHYQRSRRDIAPVSE